jgi:hypothetical protein
MLCEFYGNNNSTRDHQMKLNTIISTLIAVATVNASAASVTFDFTINSSTPNLYVCNTGLKKPAGIPGTDRATVTYAPWTDASETPGTSITRTVNAGDGRYNILINEQLGAMNLKLSSLRFDFTSEIYATTFFVDVCYRGPQVNFGTTAPTYLFSSVLTPADTTASGKSYLNAAKLSGLTEIRCDNQGAGALQAPSTSGNTVSVADTSELFGAPDFYRSLSYSMNSSAVLPFTNLAVNTGAGTPRYCFARHWFWETKTTSKRDTVGTSAKITIFDSIVER